MNDDRRKRVAELVKGLDDSEILIHDRCVIDRVVKRVVLEEILINAIMDEIKIFYNPKKR